MTYPNPQPYSTDAERQPYPVGDTKYGQLVQVSRMPVPDFDFVASIRDSDPLSILAMDGRIY